MLWKVTASRTELPGTTKEAAIQNLQKMRGTAKAGDSTKFARQPYYLVPGTTGTVRSIGTCYLEYIGLLNILLMIMSYIKIELAS